MTTLLLLLFALPARAGSFCEPAEAIYDRAEMCEDNDQFVRAADECVTKLNAEVASATAAMQAGFARNDGANQSLDFGTTAQNYATSSATLARLVERNRQALADVRAYYPLVIEPEDMDEVDDPEWVKSVPCYFRTRGAIEHVAQVLETKLRNLEATKRLADAQNASASARDRDVGAAAGSAAPVKTGVGLGSGRRVPAGKSAPSRSDITGVDQAKKKGAAGERLLENPPARTAP